MTTADRWLRALDIAGIVALGVALPTLAFSAWAAMFAPMDVPLWGRIVIATTSILGFIMLASVIPECGRCARRHKQTAS